MNTLDYDFGLQENLLAADDDGLGEDDTPEDLEADPPEGSGLPEEEEAGNSLE